MQNWHMEVRERLQACALPQEFREEVVIEFAAHLEELYDQARAAGMTDVAAQRLAPREVNDWQHLARAIRRAKSKEGLMNHRTKSLWLPALLIFLATSASLMLCQFHGMEPRMLWFDKIAITLYLPWLATLPIFGALGAYLSRRAQGATQARLAAGLSPALIMLTVMGLLLPWGLYIDGLDFFRLVVFGLTVVNWGAIPAFALFLGALPFLHDSPDADRTAN